MTMLRMVLVVVACGVVAACSGGAANVGAAGGQGGGGGGDAPTCGDVCAHVQTVCGSAPGTCVSACDAWSADLRSCVGAATSCGSIDDCAGADGGGGSSSATGSSGSSGGSGSGSGSSSSGGVADGGGAAACGKPGDPCAQDTDCQGASGYGCADNETFIPKQPQLCDDGQCHDWQTECTNVCSSMGTTCAGVLYATCSH